MKMRKPFKGFTIVELMVAVAIIGILSGLMIEAGISDWRRERVNTVAVELAGWLEAVRRAALKGTSCAVQLKVGGGSTSDLAGGATLATSTCTGVSTLPITTITPGQVFRVKASPSSWSFSPLGTLHLPDGASGTVSIFIALKDGQAPIRCVQLEGLMGVIRVGRASDFTTCNTEARF